MSAHENLLPNLLTITCWIIEMVAFLTPYMIESRSLRHLHDGIFHRCVYPEVGLPISGSRIAGFRCLWWSDDTFWIDTSSLKFCTIMAFISLITIGLMAVFSVMQSLLFTSFCKEMHIRRYNFVMAFGHAINGVILVLFVIIYTFVYATNTRFIPLDSTSLAFSWSYYLLFAAFGLNIISVIFLMHNSHNQKKKNSQNQVYLLRRSL